MTDMERFIELYKSFGIELKAEKNKKWISIREGTYEDAPGYTISIEEGDHPKLGGYAGFGTVIEFTEDGKFLKQDFWE